MTVEEVRGSLDLTDNGAIKNSIRNCLTVFQNDPVLQGAVRYNILTERIDIVKPLWWSKQTATLTDTDLNYLMLYLEDKYSLTSEKKIQKALSIIADSNKYHPIRDYLNGLEWDGTERIRYALPRFLGAEEGEYTYQALRLFMLGAISRVFKPGCKFEVKLEEIEQENKKAENDCSNLFTWASTYQNASFQQRQAILNQFIKEVRVGRDYDIEIILNVPLEEFEEFKSHSLSVRTPSGRKTDLKQAPVRGLGTPNGGIVVFDKTSGEAMNIMPKSSAHVTLRCQDE